MEQENRGRRRQVDLFNFSFLDILACVIGLLIFILTIVVISGGGVASKKKAAVVDESQRAVSDARAAAEVAHNRRAQLESLLSQRANQAVDPIAAAQAMRRDTELFDSEAQMLKDATAKIERRLIVARADLTEAKKTADSETSEAASIATEITEIERQRSQALADAAEIQKHIGPKTEVQFHVPRVHQTTRKQIWTEISGGRMWFLDSDYETSPIGSRGVRYDRRLAADGVDVRSFTSGAQPVPTQLESGLAGNLVVDVALRPDGFATFREFRNWATKQGYEIHWAAFAADEPLILTRGGGNVAQ